MQRGPAAVRIGGRQIPALALVSVALAVAGVIVLAFSGFSHHNAPRPTPRAQSAPLGPASTTAAPNKPTHTTAGAPRRPTISARTTKSAPTISSGPSTNSARASNSRPTARSASSPSLPRGDGHPSMGSSPPVHLSVPAIGVSSDMLTLGLNPDATVEVPPLARHSQPGWYKFSATPGATGSAVVLGHIDSAAYGPAVFYRLGALQPGDEADLTRADGSTAVFRIDRVAEYPKTAFPTQLIYTPTSYPSLRLITCGGTFNAQTRSYEDNIIAFGTLVAQR